MTDISEPNQTIYINNINEKLKKNVLKKLLYMLFSQYGKVLQIVACKGLKMRGQAWVVFQDVASATNALKAKQNFNFYGKPFKIQFAKTKSNLIARKEGLPVVRSTKRTKDEAFENDESNETSNQQQQRTHEPPAKEQRLLFNNTPNKILLIQNLPAEITDAHLNPLFQQCAGFREVRIVPGRGLAFVEFENEIQSGIALRSLNGFQLTANYGLNLTYSQ